MGLLLPPFRSSKNPHKQEVTSESCQRSPSSSTFKTSITQLREAFARQFNYRAFWNHVTENREIVGAFAYAIEPNAGKQKSFQQILRDIGFEVKLKPYIQRSDGSSKGDWDVGITLDMLEIAEHADIVVLASGDGDFDLAVERIQERFDVTTEVYGVRPLTAASLINASTKFFPIEDDLLL